MACAINPICICFGEIMSDNLTAVTDQSFDSEVISSDMPVIVDFWAEWCGPCKAIAPIFEEAATKLSGRAKFMKLDVSDNKETPAKYNIRGIPTLILFKDGQNVATHVGGDLSLDKLVSFVESNI